MLNLRLNQKLRNDQNMNTKLQELTDKIYLEGVEKGNAEAKAIVEKAENEAAAILAKAKSEANQIIAQAEAQAAELSKNTQSELKLFAQQSVNALKTEITNLINGTIVSESVKAATADKAFMQKTILMLVQEWAKNQEVVIEAKDAKALTDYFASNAKNLLNQNVKIYQANNVKADFTIIPQKDGYKITFGDEEFMAYFKEFLRPKLVEMLFNS
jgi:V/A-type H+-transporting ATPase subunit E